MKKKQVEKNTRAPAKNNAIFSQSPNRNSPTEKYLRITKGTTETTEREGLERLAPARVKGGVARRGRGRGHLHLHYDWEINVWRTPHTLAGKRPAKYVA